MTEFKMPTLGADMEAGTLVTWLKKPGDTVARGDIIAVVDTDKGAIEIEVFSAGVIDRLLVEPGQKTPVGTVLALIRAPGEPAGAAPVQAPSSPSAAAPAPSAVATPRAAAEGSRAPGAPGPPAEASVDHGARVSPAARKAAAELHVDLRAVEGHGPGGAITVADVERAAASGGETKPAAPARLKGMRAAVGAAMARSKREIPHLYLSNTVDLTPALAWLREANERRPVTDRVLAAVMFIKAVSRALVEVPDVNGFWTEQGFTPGAGIHVGCAIALRGGGLVAPALHDVNTKSLETVGRELGDLVTRARTGALRSSEMSDSTITLTNLGEIGAESAYAIIYPPQVAIVGFGRIVERPWVVDGRIEPRSVVTISVSADHRAVDGRTAGAFLTAIERALLAPETL